MEVSRLDIPTKELVRYPNEFLKVPAKPYLELLEIEPVEPQIALLNALNNPKYRFITGALSRRLGKTFIANVAGQLVSFVPGSNVLIMSPNYSLSQISFDLQRTLIRKFDLEVTRDNSKDKVIELENSSTIRMGSVNQVDSTVGRSYDLIIFDEAALADGMEAFNVALRPTLDKPNSKAIFISTPRGRNNWFSELYQRGFSDEFANWVSIHATYKDNPRAAESDIEEARRSMTRAEFEQEYMASFNTYEGQIWQFDEENIQDVSEIAGMDVFAGLDVGFKDPTAFVVIATDYENFYVVDEYQQNERTTEEHAKEIRRLQDKWGIETIFIDSAAQQTRFDFAQNFNIATNNAKKSVLDGIAAVGVIVENKRLFVAPHCKHTLYALDQYRWDELREKPAHTDASHMADALRYALYTFETMTPTF